MILVLGDAPCLLDDLNLFAGMDKGLIWKAMAVNRAGLRYGDHIDHWATYHPNELPQWAQERERAGGNMDFSVHAGCDWPGVDWVWSMEGPPGSSSLLAVQAALGLGFKHIILAGCPLSDQAYNEKYAAGWLHWAARFEGQVKSLSGWTKRLLGEPTREWLTS